MIALVEATNAKVRLGGFRQRSRANIQGGRGTERIERRARKRNRTIPMSWVEYPGL